MTIIRASDTPELTCEEIHAGFDALITRIADMAAERDLARKLASDATKDLVRVRDETQARIEVHNVLVSSLRALIDDKNADIRRLNTRVRELALANEDLRKRDSEQPQQPASETTRTRWSVFGHRIGNSL